MKKPQKYKCPLCGKSYRLGDMASHLRYDIWISDDQERNDNGHDIDGCPCGEIGNDNTINALNHIIEHVRDGTISDHLAKFAIVRGRNWK